MNISITTGTTTKPQSVAFNYAVTGFTSHNVSVNPEALWIVDGKPVADGILSNNGGNVMNADYVISSLANVGANWIIPFPFPVIVTVIAWNTVSNATVNKTWKSVRIDSQGNMIDVQTPKYISDGGVRPVPTFGT